MLKRGWIALLLIVPLVWVQAQLAPDDDGVEVTFPTAVSLLRGTVEITGTIDVPGESGYFIQFRELDDTLEPINGPNALWSPAALPGQGRILDDVIGVWNTVLVEDGIYELELVVNREDDDPIRVPIRPVRVANELPTFDGARYSTGGDDMVQAIMTPFPTPGGGLGTPVSTLPAARPTDVPDQVTVTALIEANVRLGDSVSYPPVGFLRVGQEAPAIGASNRSNWIQIRLPSGQVGFISPSTVRVNGDLFTLPRVSPPPLPFTPTPTATNTPVASANLTITALRLDPGNPQCGETFRVIATVQNNGTAATSASASVSVRDVHIGSGTTTETTIGGVPVLNPGSSFDAIMPLTVTAFFEEGHRIEVTVDPGNAIVETNNGDNSSAIEYTLAQASCG